MVSKPIFWHDPPYHKTMKKCRGNYCGHVRVSPDKVQQQPSAQTRPRSRQLADTDLRKLFSSVGEVERDCVSHLKLAPSGSGTVETLTFHLATNPAERMASGDEKRSDGEQARFGAGVAQPRPGSCHISPANLVSRPSWNPQFWLP